MTEQKNKSNAGQRQKTPLCGVVGRPIEHSLSPPIHQDFALQCEMSLLYHKILGDLDNFEQQIHGLFEEGYRGLNITLPFKERAFALATHTTARAKAAKAANALWMEEGELWADNTDGLGLVYSLKKHTDLANKQVLILGAGGGCRGVIYPLLQAGVQTLTVANRDVTRRERLQNDFPDIETTALNQIGGHYDIIISATSASLSHEPVEINENLFPGSICLDMVYDLDKATDFITFAKENRASCYTDGLEMLVGQAAASFEIWHNKTPSADLTLERLIKKIKN